MVLPHVTALSETLRSQESQGAEAMGATAARWQDSASARANVGCQGYQLVHIGLLEHFASLRVLVHSFVQHLTFNKRQTITISAAPFDYV